MRTFTYHRAIAPMMWVLVALMTVELVVVHLLLAAWYPRVAIVLAAVTLATIIWLIRAILAFPRLPVTVGPDALVMRVGRMRSITVPLTSVAVLRSGSWSAADLKQPGVVNMALIAFPNVIVELVPPVTTRRGREVRAIAHRLDDPGGFAAAIAGLGRRDD